MITNYKEVDDVRYYEPANYHLKSDKDHSVAHIIAIAVLGVILCGLVWASSQGYDAFVQASYLIK